MEFVSHIFLDGGDPDETRQADELLKQNGHKGLEGQTTNPSLIMKRAIDKLSYHGSPRTQLRTREAVAFYRSTVEEIADVTDGPISVQVVGDDDTPYTEFLRQASDYMTWGKNVVVKFPCNYAGIKAAAEFVNNGPVNMTLVFSQEQAAAVYAATRNHRHEVYVSPFIGRLDDKGLNGMDVAASILRMYREKGDGHVKLIAASVRRIDHILYALQLKCDIISIPFSLLKAWEHLGFPTPSDNFTYDPHRLSDIPYRDILLTHDWIEYAYNEELTAAGITKFYSDWQSIIEKK